MQLKTSVMIKLLQIFNLYTRHYKIGFPQLVRYVLVYACVHIYHECQKPIRKLELTQGCAKTVQ